jgi:hypothetical protein
MHRTIRQVVAGLTQLMSMGILGLLPVTAPSVLHGQEILAIPSARAASRVPRQVATESTRSALLSSMGIAPNTTDSTERLKENERAYWLTFWNQDPTTLLSGARLAVGSDNGSLYTQLASIVSGRWKVNAGTTLSAAKQGASDNEAQTAADEPSTETDEQKAAFQRFLAGGGNLSLSGVYPFKPHRWNEAAGYVFFVPRGWVDVPSLSNTDNVKSYGTDLGVELDYHRLRSDDDSPFLVFQLRGSVALGSAAFYDGIGVSRHSVFVYAAPSVAFVAQDRVKLGVSGFIGPGSLNRHGQVQVNVTLLDKPKNSTQ